MTRLPKMQENWAQLRGTAQRLLPPVTQNAQNYSSSCVFLDQEQGFPVGLTNELSGQPCPI
jgi:hypothetical protein